MNREIVERAIDPKNYTILGKLNSFQNVPGVPRIAYNPFMNAYFDSEQIKVLVFWVERVKEIGMLTFDCRDWESSKRNEWSNPRFRN